MDYRSAVHPGSSQSLSRSQEQQSDLKPFEDMVQYLSSYARERPEIAALTCFGIGFILGWKLKPW